jgi:surfactin synthase thioesterase subunit
MGAWVVYEMAHELRRRGGQGLTLVHFSAQPQPFWSHLPVSPCLIDRETIMYPKNPTKHAYDEPNSGKV